MTLLVAVIMAPAVLYLSFRYYYLFQHNTNGKKYLSVLPAALFISFYAFPVAGGLYYLFNGDIDLLNYAPALTYWFWFGLVYSYLLLTWVLLADVVKLIIQRGLKKKITGRFHYRFTFFMLIAIFFFVGFKTYKDTTGITIREHQVQIEDLPQQLEGFKIAHLTDIQGDEYTGRDKIARYIDKLNEQHPDLIVFTGDLISYGTDFIKMSAEEFGKAEATHGIVGVIGDHDFWAGVEEVEEALSQENIPLLKNENVIVESDSDSIPLVKITGITEVYSQPSDSTVVDSLLGEQNAPPVKLMASHQVSEQLVVQALHRGYHFLLGGHTHGGQIKVPFMGMKFSASEFETEYVNGIYQKGDLTVNVDNGLGFTLAPIRYNAPPTISIITLKGE